MRTFAIVAGCLAWALSCFIAVSLYRSGEQAKAAQVQLQAALNDAHAATASAGLDAEHLRRRIEQDQTTVAGEQALLQQHQASQKAEDAQSLQDRQALAADQAALQADRMLQYTVENFAHTDPNPAVVAAENKVDVLQRIAADAVATRVRDHSLLHVAYGFWTLTAGCALLAWRNARAAAATQLPPEGDEEPMQLQDEVLEDEFETTEAVEGSD